MEMVVENVLKELTETKKMPSQKGKGPKRLLIMAGLPLSGKSYFVSMLMRKRPDRFIWVTSHYLRPVVAKHLGRKRPIYDKLEHITTFDVAHHVIIKCLEMNWPVIADATNLKETYRKWAIDAGDAAGAETVVVFMQVSEEGAKNRISERTSGSSATFEVFQKLRFDVEPYTKCSKPYLVIDSEVDISPHVSNVAKWLSGERDFIPGSAHAMHPSH